MSGNQICSICIEHSSCSYRVCEKCFTGKPLLPPYQNICTSIDEGVHKIVPTTMYNMVHCYKCSFVTNTFYKLCNKCS